MPRSRRSSPRSAPRAASPTCCAACSPPASTSCASISRTARPKDHVERATLVRDAARALGREVAIMADLQGPKIRIGKFADGKVELKPGATLHPRRRMRARRRDARRPRLPRARPGRAARLGAAARRRADQARGRVRRRPADHDARRPRRHAVEQQGHQPHGRRPVRAGADDEGHGRRQDGRAARGRLPGRVVSRRARKTCTWRAS